MDAFRLPADTKMGFVHLQTPNIDRLLSFYVDLLGFVETGKDNKTTFLAAQNKTTPQILLTENTNALPRNKYSPGLFHAAFLLPTRFALAQILKRLIQHNLRLGFGDHGVSEAIYLSDPDGNGVELYADRPREQWPVVNGKIEMYTEPVDTKSLLQELGSKPQPWSGIDPGTTIGHMHLQVSDLAKAAHFYHQLIGFDVTQQSYPGALFVSAGGYHHHLGLNTWNSHNMPVAPPDATGLVSYSIVLPGKTVLQTLRNRIEEAGINTVPLHSVIEIQDYDQITIHVQAK